MTRKPPRFVALPLTVTVASAIATMLVTTGALGSPVDPYAGSANINTTAPRPAVLNDGDYGVDEERGAVTYSFPIKVPPGRNGAAPALALNYSSQAPLRGGIAVGWSLSSLPTVEVDPTAPQGTVRYRINGSTRLVAVTDSHASGNTDQIFRAQFDASMTRWEYSPTAVAGGRWIARGLDGSKMDFRRIVGDPRWRLTSQQDRNGNRIFYQWEKTTFPSAQMVGAELTMIMYGGNEAASLGHYARVAFNYSASPIPSGSSLPIGASLDWVNGEANGRLDPAVGVVSGARQLDSITTTVKDTPSSAWRSVQTVQLTYHLTDATKGAQLRFLQQIDVSARPPCAPGATCPMTVAPPITFQYGDNPSNGTYERQFDVGHEATYLGSTSVLHPKTRGRSGDSAGATTGFLDIDSDGRRDFVSVAAEPQVEGGPSICTLTVYPGDGSGAFGTPFKVPLPTLPWNNGHDPSPDPGFDRGTNSHVVERCTLTGQHVFHRATMTLAPGRTCSNDWYAIKGYYFMDYDGDGQLDLLTDFWRSGWYDDTWNNHKRVDDEPTQEYCHGGSWDTSSGDCVCGAGTHNVPGGCVPNDPDDSLPGHTVSPVATDPPNIVGGGPDPIVTCSDFWPLRPARAGVQTSTGSQMFSFTQYTYENRVYQSLRHLISPVALPPPGQEGLMRILGGDDPFTLETITDLNGDGHTDFISTPYDSIDSEYVPQPLGVAQSLVGGAGYGGQAFGSLAYPKPNFTMMPSSGFVPRWPVAEVTVNSELVDMNHDGRADLVVRVSPTGHLFVLPNTGTRFANTAIDLGHSIPAAKVHYDISSWEDPAHTRPLATRRYRSTQLVDVDNDGRPDLYEIQFEDRIVDGHHVSVPVAKVRYNQGDIFGEQQQLDDQWVAARGFSTSTSNHTWSTDTELADVNGDGLVDLVAWTPAGGTIGTEKMTWTTDDVVHAPPRFLRVIKNGRGARTEFDYKSSSAMPGAGMAAPVWVASKVSVFAEWNTQVPTTTEYAYSLPKVGSLVSVDTYACGTETCLEMKRLPFQGFQKVEITGTPPAGQGHGSDVVKTYLYEDDGRGYLIEADEYEWPNGSIDRKLRTISKQAWETVDLFGGLIHVVRQTSDEVQICLGGTENDCRAQTLVQGGVIQDTISYADHLSGSQLAAFSESARTTITSDDSSAKRVAYALNTFVSAPTANDYRYLLLPARRWSTHGTVGSEAETYTARQQTFYDDDYFPIRERQWYGSADNEYVTSERTFDTQTGLLLTSKKPEQVRQGAAGKVAIYSYDANKVFPEVLVNEIEFGKHTYYDLGTGVPVRETGPNMAAPFTSASCTESFCQRTLQPQETVSTIDGFGRVLSVASTYRLGETVTAAPMVTLRVSAYDDANNSAVSWSLIDPSEATPRWLTTKSVSDGLGRALSQITCKNASPSAFDYMCLMNAGNPVQSYRYDGAGLLTSMTSPNPADDAASATYSFAHDSLGRTTVMTRPDGSAISMEYGPLYKKALESGSVTGGGATFARTDLDGNVTEVRECQQAPCTSGPDESLVLDENWSSTDYYYDDFHRLAEVDDAHGDRTLLEHDLLGRRTKISRDDRVWKYVYDHDGNITRETSPLPAGETDESKYASVSTFDAIGRITGRAPASRGASEAQLNALWSVPFVFTYDEGVNAVGQLTKVTQPASTARRYYFSAVYAYDGMDRLKQESRLMNPTGSANQGVVQTVTTTYNALGGVTQFVWDQGQTVSSTFDGQGLTKTVAFASASSGMPAQVLADYGVRNRAGLPSKRSALGGLIERSWTYDANGRVLTDLIQRPTSQAGPAVVLAERSYNYLPSGDMQTLEGKTRKLGYDALVGFQYQSLAFTYDASHRLKTAHEDVTRYALGLTYDSVGNILTANVSGLPRMGGADRNRNVIYEYDPLDSQAVSKLLDAQTRAPIAVMTYSPMGEMTSRNWPLGSELSLTWDGEGQTREARSPDGTIEQYAYDHLGQRIWAVKSNAVDAGTRYWFGASETYVPASGGSGGTRRIYISEGAAALGRGEVDATGFPSVEVSFADSLSNLMLTARSSTPGESAERAAVVTSWFHYGAFGEVLAQGGAGDHHRQFNGKEADATTGLRYYGARYYDPLLMRWTSSDPLYRFAPDVDLLSPQRQNLYAFSGNNPVRFMDADGHDWSDDVRAGIKGGIRAATKIACESGIPCPVGTYFRSQGKKGEPSSSYAANKDLGSPLPKPSILPSGSGATMTEAGADRLEQIEFASKVRLIDAAVDGGVSDLVSGDPERVGAGIVKIALPIAAVFLGNLAGVAASDGKLVTMADAAFEFGTVRTVAGYQIGGTAGLVGQTYNVNLWALYATDSSQGLGAFLSALRAEAAAAGANRISIMGTAIINPGLMRISPAAAARFGLLMTKINDATILLQGAVQ